MTGSKRIALNTTLTSLSSTLENCLKWHEDEISHWLQRREILERKRGMEAPFEGRSYDKAEYDFADEVWALNEGRSVAFELLLDLHVAVTHNPFSGEKKRLLEVATELFPQVQISFLPKCVFSGRAAWREILRQFELDASQEVWFPIREDDVDLEQVECRLLQLAGHREEMPLQEARVVLCWKPKSKTYSYVKVGLEERGWRWRCVKRAGKVSKVICVPKR